jgi:hypothetical protein
MEDDEADAVVVSDGEVMIRHLNGAIYFVDIGGIWKWLIDVKAEEECEAVKWRRFQTRRRPQFT